MDIRKLSNPLAILAAILVVAVLSLLIVESRAVKANYYTSHSDRVRAIELSQAEIGAILAGLNEASDSGTDVAADIQANFARLRGSNETLQSFSNVPREPVEVAPRLEQYGTSLLYFLARSEYFVTTQTKLSAELQRLQDESPQVVKSLREQGLPAQSRAVFSLAINTIEYSSGRGDSSPAQLRSRLAELRDDPSLQSVLPEMMTEFLTVAETVIDEHVTASLTLSAINQSTVVEDLAGLRTALADFDLNTVQRAEVARVLLAVCAVLLLLGAAFAIYQLQSSYRELNQSNRDLQISNETLEERVTARTEQLQSAYGELKESQVQLIHAEKMSSLGEMIAGISHEINTPLWYLMSNSSVIQERLGTVKELCDVADSMVVAALSGPEGDSSIRKGLVEMHRMMKSGIKEEIDEARDLAQDNIDGLDDLSALAQGLKDFSRLDRAQQSLFNINEGLDKALLILNNRLKNRIDVHKYYGDIPAIHCSPSQINQIFLNLLTNAADAIQGIGDIVVQTREENGKVVINIGDTGIGIPADVLPKIRDPFYTTKDVGKGTGLGLSIVDQIVSSHKGDLHVESQPGKGTTITIELPTTAAGAVTIEHGLEPQDELDDSFPEIISMNTAALNPGSGLPGDGYVAASENQQ